MDFIEYIRPELLIVAVVLYLIGFGLKKWNKIKDNYIPLILGTIGVVVCIIYLIIVEGCSYPTFICGIVQGVLTAAASTYVNQVIKQMKKLGVNETITDVSEKVIDAVQKDNSKER